MSINIYFAPSMYESKYLESTIQNVLETEARLDSTSPIEPNPTLPRQSVKLVHLIDPIDPTKPLRLPHYLPITLTIRLNILSSTSTTQGRLSERYLSCSVLFPPDIWTTDQIEIPFWPRHPHLLDGPEAALWSIFKLAPSILKVKSTHVTDIAITVPVEQLQYQQGADPIRQFFPDEHGMLYRQNDIS